MFKTMMITALIALFGLSACGKKGPLDKPLPPEEKEEARLILNQAG